MIVFELQCRLNHRFEGWFASGDDFDDQQRRGLLTCPNCGGSHVSKLLTAKIGKSESASRPANVPVPAQGPAAQSDQGASVQVGMPDEKQFMALIEHVMANTENVGARFAEEARRIQHGEAPERGIRGKASPEEVSELLDEGIGVVPLPVPPREDWH